MKHLYFIRHGESEFNKSRIWSGSTDVPLTAAGQAQAKLAGQKLKRRGVAIDAIISSPLERAHQTAKLVATETGYPPNKIQLHDLLIERNYGELEGNKNLVAATKYVVDESAIDSYAGVESLADLQQRAEQVLQYLHSLPHDSILIVGHGASGRALRRAINKEPLSRRGKSMPNAEVLKLI